MGTIRCGFWKLRFLLSPESMKEWLELCKEHNICFEIPNSERTKHTIEQVYDAYCRFYESLMATEISDHDSIRVPAYTMSFLTGNKIKPVSSFSLVPFDYDIYNSEFNRKIKTIDLCLQISYPKSIAITSEDNKYFTYEDIKLHVPSGYPLFVQLTDFIKKHTKPLRFVTNGVEQKPSIRISVQAKFDLACSWIAKKYGWIIK